MPGSTTAVGAWRGSSRGIGDTTHCCFGRRNEIREANSNTFNANKQNNNNSNNKRCDYERERENTRFTPNLPTTVPNHSAGGETGHPQPFILSVAPQPSLSGLLCPLYHLRHRRDAVLNDNSLICFIRLGPSIGPTIMPSVKEAPLNLFLAPDGLNDVLDHPRHRFSSCFGARNKRKKIDSSAHQRRCQLLLLLIFVVCSSGFFSIALIGQDDKHAHRLICYCPFCVILSSSVRPVAQHIFSGATFDPTMASRIEVYCRVRPTDKMCAQQVHFLPGNTTIQINRNARRSAVGLDAEQQILHTFTFDSIFTGSQATQENVYRATTMKLVQKGLLDGINGSLLCYGQRDSGKTYTVFGGSDFRARGIAARAINQLFEGVRLYAQERVYTVALTFLQIHGEAVTDLLSGASSSPGGKGRGTMGRSVQRADAVRPNITLDGKGMVSLKGIERRECASEEEALAAVFEGLHNRSQGRNAHVALTLYARHQSLIDSESDTRDACLHIVDLAGTQRVEGLSPEERSEVQTVNRSLSMLEQVVLCLGNPPTNNNGEPVQGHIPYRQSKLTTLLKDCIGGTSLTSVIAHIYPEQQFIDNTISTLNFAKRVMHVATDPTVNVVQDAGTQIRTLQRQLTDLKSELRMQSQLSLARVAQASSAENASKPLTFGTDELQALHEKVRAYVDGASNTIHVNDVREMNACFSFFRTLLEQKDVTISELQNEMNAAKAQNMVQRDRGNRSDADSSSSAAGAGGGGEASAPTCNSANAKAAPPTTKNKRRTTNYGRQQQQPEKTDLHTPNVLDKNSGISYGVAGKASNTLQVPDRESLETPRSDGTPAEAVLAQTRITNAEVAPMPPIFKSTSAPLAEPPADRTPATYSGRAVPAAQTFPASAIRPASGSSRFRPGAADSSSTHPPAAQISTHNSSASRSVDPQAKQAAKARAFEDYKNTESGALQVRALGEDREQLLRIDKKLDSLHHRLHELECVMEEKANNPSGGIRVPGSRPHSGGHAHGDPAGEDDNEDPRHMSALHLTAYHNTIQESLNVVNAQRSHLVKQMERRRTALMTNFSEWYARISGDPSERPQRSGHAGFPQIPNPQPGTAGGAPKAPRRQQTSFLGVVEGGDDDVQHMMQLQEDRFLDAAERFDAMEMHRRTAQDPHSGAFYAAKKLVESKTRDRPVNRTSGNAAAAAESDATNTSVSPRTGLRFCVFQAFHVSVCDAFKSPSELVEVAYHSFRM
eukprot:gene11239-7808_t